LAAEMTPMRRTRYMGESSLGRPSPPERDERVAPHRF
jgi:hypothetical protein